MLQAKRTAKRSVSDSADDIRVVHNKQPPTKLQGILKQRTVSESSDDHSGSFSRQLSSAGGDGGGGGSTSAISESEGNTSGDDSSSTPLGRKKSVSFSEHVDSATFRCNQSVSSMREAIKKKEKKHEQRQKQRQRRQNQGRRRRSSNSVSEPSSDEQAHDDSARASGQPDSDVTPSTNGAGKQPAKPSSNGNSSPRAKHKQLPTSTTGSDNDNNEPLLEKAQSESEAVEVSERATVGVENGHEPATVNGTAATDSSNGVVDNGNGDGERTSNGNDSDDDDDAANDVVSGEQSNGAHEPNPDAPETMLNWREGPHDESLKPKCAVALSNDVMFDLDVD